MPDLTGQSLGCYHILEQLDQDGMAMVYKAYDTRQETDAEKAVSWDDNMEKRVYPWGNTFIGSLVNFCDKNCPLTNDADTSIDDGYEFTAPVGNYRGGASFYGLFDTAGNVWEWVADWYSDTYYANSPSSNPIGPSSGGFRVLEGGSYGEGSGWWIGFWINNQSICLSDRTLYIPTDICDADIGFRCARSEKF